MGRALASDPRTVNYGEVRITFCVVPRKQVADVVDLIETTNPGAFITVEQTTTVRLRQRHQ